MQGVAATWLMTSLTSSPLPVALLTTMASLPFFLVGLPAGALADVMERRWLVLVTQIWMLVFAVLLGVFVASGWMTTWLLLGFTFMLSLGGALSAPAWQAIVPQLVPKEQLGAAIALNSAGFNLARAVGPALGGILVAATGPASVFLLNAVSFIGVIIVIYRWQSPPVEQPKLAEGVRSAVAAGMRFARHSRPLRAVLIRTAVFVFPASALWALLPVVANRQLGLSATGYGVLLGSIGLGAVGGASILPWLRERLSVDRLAVIFMLIFAGSMVILALIHNLIVLNAALVAVGVSWLIITSLLNVGAQTTTPDWVQARALGVYMLVFQGGFAGGSAGWGVVAGRFGEQNALLAATGLLVVGLTAALRWHLITGEELDLSPSQHWPEPEMVLEPQAEDGPVLVTIAYQVPEAQQEAFCQAMGEVQIIRLRDGATRWEMFRDGADPERLLEAFVVSSWAEHLRQLERSTVMDQEVEAQALALLEPGSSPVVSHFIATTCPIYAETT